MKRKLVKIMSIHLESSSFSKPLVTPPEEFFCQLHEFLSVFLESVQDAGELSYERLIQNCLSCDHAGIKILIPFPKTLLDRSPHPIDINQAFLDIKELYKRHQSTFVKEFQTSFEETFSNLSTPIEKIESFLACLTSSTS